MHKLDYPSRHLFMDKVRHSPNHDRHSQNAQAYPSHTIVHAKLEMTEPGDHDEQEADAVANAIVSGGKISRKISGGGGSSGIAVSQQMESQLSQLQGGGRQMPEGLRNMMESGFGQDFSQVRLHTDNEAASMSSSIHAKAFTHGNDIYFNQGQFSPETSEGQHLVAHELAHIMQKKKKLSRKAPNSGEIVLDYNKNRNDLFDIIDALINNDSSVFQKPQFKGMKIKISNPGDYKTALVFIWHWLRERRNFSEDQALAILANWDHESGLDPTRVEGLLDRNTAEYGVLNPNRLEQMKKRLIDIYTENLSTEEGFNLNEKEKQSQINGDKVIVKSIETLPIDNNKVKIQGNQVTIKRHKGTESLTLGIVHDNVIAEIIEDEEKKKNVKVTKTREYTIDGEKVFWWEEEKDGKKIRLLKRWTQSIKKEQRLSLAGLGIGQWTGNRMWHAKRGLSSFISKREQFYKKINIDINVNNDPDIDTKRFLLITQLAFAVSENRGGAFKKLKPNETGIWTTHYTDEKQTYSLDTPLKQFMYHFEGVTTAVDKRQESMDAIKKILIEERLLSSTTQP